MKKNIFITLFLLFISVFSLNAETLSNQNQSLKWNIQTRPFYPLIWSGFSMLANYQINPSIAIGPDIAFYQEKDSFVADGYKSKRFVVGINSIYFFSDKGISSDGATLTGNISYGKFYLTNDGKEDGPKEMEADTYSTELLIGYHWIYSNHISLDIGIGGKYMFLVDEFRRHKDLDTYVQGSEKEMIIPTAEFTIGYAF